MPRRVFDIVGIHGAVGFELRTAVLVSAGVIERDSALPELWRNCGNLLRQFVEPGYRLVNPSAQKIRARAIEHFSRTLPKLLRRSRPSK